MAKVLEAVLLVWALAGCNGTRIPAVSSPTVPVTPTDALPVGGAKFDSYGLSDLIADRVLAPNITTMRNNPVVALGTTYARVALPGKTCADEADTAWKFVRLFSLRSRKCEVETKPGGDQLVSKKVKGGGGASFKLLLGSVSADAESAFELFISEPVAAYFKDSAQCFDDEALKTMTLPDPWVIG